LQVKIQVNHLCNFQLAYSNQCSKLFLKKAKWEIGIIIIPWRNIIAKF